MKDIEAVLAGSSSWAVVEGDCLDVLRAMPDACVDAVVTDPPAGIAFMGKTWDDPRAWEQPITGHGFTDGGDRRPAPSIGTSARNPMCRTCHLHKRGWKDHPGCSCAAPEFDDGDHRFDVRRYFVEWLTAVMREVLRVLKPGGHALVWAIPRTSHWTATALEDAGFEVREKIYHLFGSGFPKSSRVNRDPRFCQCGEPARSGASTTPSQPLVNHNDKVAGADGGGPRCADDLRSTGRPQDSRGDCPPGYGSCDAHAPQWQEDGQASLLPLGCAPARSHSAAPEDDRADGQVRSPSPARRNAPPSSLDFVRPGCDEPQVQRDKSESTPTARRRDSDGASPEHRILSTVEFPLACEQFTNGLPICQVCGKPNADGFGTALKPAAEEWVLARKPLIGTVAANVIKHGTGALNIDGCRITGPKGTGHWSGDDGSDETSRQGYDGGFTKGGRARAPQSDPAKREGVVGSNLGFSRASAEQMHAAQAASIERMESMGRWPANVVLDEEAAALLDAQSGELTSGVMKAGTRRTQGGGYHGHFPVVATAHDTGGDTGGASRFFYTAKAAKSERNLGGASNVHPTVKSLDLMRWLCRLITPPGAVVLDPFAGSGSTVVAALREGFRCIGIEREPEYVKIARHRVEEDAPLMRRERPTLPTRVNETVERTDDSPPAQMSLLDAMKR